MKSRTPVELLEPRSLLSVSVAGVAPAPDRFEPNDGFSAATDLGTLGDRTENNLTIHAAGNGDYYKFKAASSGTASVRVVFDQAQGDIDAFLLNTDRLLLDSSATTNSGERLDASVSSGQTYYIKVIGYNGATSPDYDLVIDAPGGTASADADDQISEAIAVSVNSSTSGSISPGTDVDMYRFTVAAGQKVHFDVDRASGSSLDSYLKLFNASGSGLKSSNDANAPGETASTPRESYFNYTFSAAGTYYVAVSGYGNTGFSANTGGSDRSGSTGGYVLRLSTETVSTGDTDDQISEARSLSVGSSYTGSISNPTDVDMYKFTARAGQRIAFDVDMNSSSLDSYVRVFNASGTRLAGNNNAPAPGEPSDTKSAYVEYIFSTAGTYYVGVSGNPNSSYSATTGNGDVAGATGGYKLFLVNRSTTTAAAPALASSLDVTPVWSELAIGGVLTER